MDGRIKMVVSGLVVVLLSLKEHLMSRSDRRPAGIASLGRDDVSVLENLKNCRFGSRYRTQADSLRLIRLGDGWPVLTEGFNIELNHLAHRKFSVNIVR